MKMVTWGETRFPYTLQMYSLDSVQIQTCVCLFGLHISTAYIKLKQQESFFLYQPCTQLTVPHVLSQCLQRSWHFQYKIFTLPLVILTFITFVAICYYWSEYSEHIKNGVRMLELLSTNFIWIPEEKKKKCEV